MGKLLSAREQKTEKRRKRAIAVMASLAVLMLLSPAIWSSMDTLIAEDHSRRPGPQVTLLFLFLFPALLAALIAGWRNRMDVHKGSVTSLVPFVSVSVRNGRITRNKTMSDTFPIRDPEPFTFSEEMKLIPRWSMALAAIAFVATQYLFWVVIPAHQHHPAGPPVGMRVYFSLSWSALAALYMLMIGYVTRCPAPRHEHALLDPHLHRHARRNRRSALLHAAAAGCLPLSRLRHRCPERLSLLPAVLLPGVGGMRKLLRQRKHDGYVLRPLRTRHRQGQRPRTAEDLPLLKTRQRIPASCLQLANGPRRLDVTPPRETLLTRLPAPLPGNCSILPLKHHADYRTHYRQ